MRLLSLCRAGLFNTNKKYFKDNKLFNIELNTDDKSQTLNKLAEVIAKNNLNMTFLKTRLKDHSYHGQKKITISMSLEKIPESKMAPFISQLRKIGRINFPGPVQVPWFPKSEEDVDQLGKTLLEVKDQVNRDHLQFTDPEYRKRRDQIAKIALNSNFFEKIPEVEYSKEETDLWCRIYKKLRVLHKQCMSERFEFQMEKLNKEFKVENRIPQLEELSQYLQSQTGFRLKPVHGIVSQREFLNSFAFKTFLSTQYLRNTKTPDYTPEPDIVHEIVGHIPMFADKDVAELSHKIGLISLGASDQEITKLGTLYWYTLEFGACRENGKNLGYGAGIASSIGQIQHFMSDKARFKAFEPKIDCSLPYPIQTVQEVYRVTESFEKTLEQLDDYSMSILKPISTSFDFSTKSIIYDRNIEAVPARKINPYEEAKI